jgi:hypothetical protein
MTRRQTTKKLIMKRWHGFIAVLMLAILVTGCKGMTPSSAAENMAKWMQSGDYAKIAENLASDHGADSLQIIRDKQHFIAAIREKAEKQFAKNGGIDHYNIIGEAVTPDETKAYVRISYRFKNGTTIDEIIPLVKSGGQWKYVLQ